MSVEGVEEGRVEWSGWKRKWLMVGREEVYIDRKLLFATSSDSQGRCEDGR